MTAKEEKFFKSTVWYHGTTLAGWKSICALGIRADYNVGISLDFGNGFYLSNSIANTVRYVKNMVQYNIGECEDEHIPVIIEFQFQPYEWLEQGVKYKYFPSYDEEFAEFVFMNRLNYEKTHVHNYDITAGCTTDTKPTFLMQQYLVGAIEKEDVLREFYIGTSVRQLCLHNQKQCDLLQPSRAYILEGKELNIHDYTKRKENS